MKQPIHLSHPENILLGLCGERIPLLHTTVEDEVTCAFCGYAMSQRKYQEQRAFQREVLMNQYPYLKGGKLEKRKEESSGN